MDDRIEQRIDARIDGAMRVAGLTLLEVTIACTVVAFMSVLIVQAMHGLTSTQAYTERQAATMTMSERAVQRVVRDTQFALRVFRESPESRDLLAVLDLGAIQPIAGSRMPVQSGLGYFEPDPPEKPETGNLLLLACSQPPHRSEVPGRPEPVLVDEMRFVLYCLTKPGGDVVDLSRWVSGGIARYQDLLAIDPETDRVQAALNLRADGVTIAWDTERPLATAFYKIAADGSLQPLWGSYRIDGDQARIERAILSTRRAQVAPNNSPHPVRVPAYAEWAPGFPHGFEVKVDGAGTGTLVLVRLVVASNVGEGRRANYAEVMRLCGVREE